MTSYVDHTVRYTAKIRTRTGGPKGWWRRMWDGGMFYVRRSNAWPRIPEELQIRDR